MKNKKYIVSRDDIYVGKVVKTTSAIYRNEDDMDFFRTKPGQLCTIGYKSYRSMLFVPNENGMSNDLLYRSPGYPILNVTADEICLNIGINRILIQDACNLASLLEYFGYKKDLTYEDIINIRKTFFTGTFVKDNCELFGYREFMPEDWKFYSNGKEVTDLEEIEERRRQCRLRQQAGYRIFYGVSESPLPREYFDVLDYMGDNTLIKYRNEKINAFEPDRQEGPVKKLSIF